MLEYCIIEYGGQTQTGYGNQTHQANLTIERASPTLQYNTIQNSSHSGISVYGSGSNDAVIRYNAFTQNPNGIYTTGSAQPAINYNNFMGNTLYGVYNADSSVTVNAEHNWWGAESGPFDDSDDTATGGLYNPVGNGEPVSNYVDYDPWQTGEIVNSLPYEPNTPTPADGAVNVPLDAGTVTLRWIGGDPDAWDSVEYDVSWGLAADALTHIATTNPDEAQFVKDAVAEGTTYFWQIVARDTAGATATSPVWQLTTQGQPPDVVVTSITWEPTANIEADQEVTFTATIQNVGAGPVVDAFQVEFQVDSASLGTVPVDPILYPNDSVTLTHTWSAVAGSHTITVVADSTDTVFEDTNEGNNDHAETLEVLDVLPPEVVSLVPEDGASLQQLSQIVITVADQHGTVDDAAVIASIEVRDSSNQPVAGMVSESSDSFTFTPDLSPFADGTYTLSFTAKDTAGNEQTHTTSFTIDAAPPAAPTITGGTVNPSGQIQERPFENQSTSSAILLTGTREENTSVWINNDVKLDVGSGDWSVTLSLTQGDNALEVFLQDAAGNPSDAVWVDIFVDSVAPAITSLDPADGSFLTTAPAAVVIAFQEVTSGMNWGNSTHVLYDGSMTEVGGNWDSSVDNQLIFTPTDPFTEDTYTLNLVFEDNLGNQSPAIQAQFTVDAQPPAAPTITGGEVLSGPIQERPFQNQSTSATVTLTGTREDETSVWISGEQHVAVGSGEWSVNLSLPEGDNELEIFLLDQADNPSDSVWVDMFVDSVAPGITAVTPEEDSFLNTAPATVVVDFQEAGSGLDLASSVSVLRDGSMAEVAGNWEASGGNHLLFTPDAALVESAYTVVLQLTDHLGNQGPVVQSHFTVDTTPPPDPVVDVVSPVQNSQQVISGTKEAYAAILLIEGSDKTEIVGFTPSMTWQYPVTLTIEGANPFTFTARDRAGNQSGDVPVTITYDDTPPLPLTTLTVDGVGDGTQALLDWSGYDESEHGDIVSYRIYAETSAITGVADLQTLLGEVSAGTFVYTAENLTKGATYWFAVVPVDANDQRPAEVSPVSETLSDTVAPEDATNLQVQCFGDRLVFTWDPSINSAGDLAGYNVYFNDASTAEFLPAGTTSSEKTGLTLATAYPFNIKAVDTDNNESSGVSITGITLLDNPTGLSVTDEQSGYVTITWTPIDAAQQSHLKHYAVYVSETDFFTVEGLTPWQTTTATTTGVAGLTNNTTYYIAVTAVNHAKGERKSPVTTVTATPQPDTQGPTIGTVMMDEVALNDGDTVTKPVKFSVEASDPSGMSRVEFAINGTVLRKDYNGDPNYFCYWNVIPIPDDSYTLDITAYDTLGNSSTESYTLHVTLDPPPAPTITQPENGLLTNETTVTVSGTAVLSSEVLLFNNSTQVGEAVTVDSGGDFTMSLPLAEGANQIQAQARYRGDGGPISTLSDPAVTVTRDTSLPSAPTNLTAQSKAGGEIKLTWRASTTVSVKGYKLYRATVPFTTVADAELVNSTHLLTGTTSTDLPAADGEYFYRLISVSYADNESELSDEVVVQSDRQGPKATEITSRSANFNLPGPFAPGTVNITLTVDEPLQAVPFLSITPENGFPISLDLTKVSDLEYQGSFEIEESTPTGTAYAVFSARDLAGNRGTEIAGGGSFEIDTDGPAVTRLVIQPEHPIQNDEQNPVSVTVTIGLDEAMKSGETPSLSYELSGPGRVPVAIATLTEVPPEGDVIQAWQGNFTLPSDAGTPGSAGASPAEYLSFIYQGVDDLENIGDTICANGTVANEDVCGTSFQIYQGDLPALPVPTGLAAESLPGGKINLTWNPVEHAAEYQLYRKAPGESDLTAYQRVPHSPLEGGQGGVFIEYLDEPTTDGTYTYAVASVRQENTQESLSEMSDPVEAVSDATPPAAPQNLTVTPVSQGIFITWDDSQNAEPVIYRLYRASGTEIRPEDIETLTPVIPEIPVQYLTTGFLDPNPSTAEPCYAMTAIDALGNESAPSDSVYHNVGLLPVSDLHVRQQDTDLPVVSWSPSTAGSIAGYDISVGSEGQEVKLNTTLLTDSTYTDTGYAGSDRRYTIVAVDVNATESLGHSITLPTVRPELVEGSSSLKRGVMNRLEFEVNNLSSTRIPNAHLTVQVESRVHTSMMFSLEPRETKVIPMIIGGDEDLPDLATLTATVVITPNAGETVEIIRSSEIDVVDGMLVAQILNEAFTRGVSGTVRFTLENTGEEDIEIITASGSSASPDIRYVLLDGDGNVLSSAPYYGEGSRKSADGSSVAVIPAGSIFESEPTTLPIPVNAPDTVTVRLTIDHLYAHQGLSDQVTMDGLSTTHQVSLIDTAYYGEVLDITPESSWGDEEIVISGRAVERATGEPMPEVPLNLTISVAGFDRTKEIFTGSDGMFTYIFAPLSGESGIYTVRVMHPDLRDRPVHGTFVIQRVGITPAAIDLELEKNYQQTIGIQVKTGEGTTLTNLRLVYDEADQPGGVFPQGVHVTIPGSAGVSPASSPTTLPFTIWADNTADETTTLVLRVVSDECHDETCPVSGQQEWETIVIDASFSDPAPPTPPQPYLFVTPGYVETGAAHGEVTTEIVTLKNQGDADLHDVSLTLLADQSGTPAPAWIALNSPAIIDVIPAGGQREVRLLFSPTAAVLEGQHSAYLRIASPEVPSLDLGLYATVTQSGEGNVLLKVSDIYTGTLDAQGQLIQGLAGARIRIQNEVVTTVERTGSTDTAGELLLEDLPAGRYAYRITASEHYEHSGRFWIKPGLTTTQEVFLEYNVISVEWDVKEITIEDRYEVVLNTTYKTDVPAAVVVTEPASVTLPKMRPGDVFQGEITFTNHGLIRADHLQVFLPEDDQYFRYELLGGLPDSLGAKQSITVPYRVTRLQTLDPGEGDGTGGGCQRYANCWKTAYDFTCANGITLERFLKTCFIAYPCSDDGDGSDGGDGGDGNDDVDDDDWGSWIHDGDLQPDIWKIHRDSGGGGGSSGSYSPGSGLDSGKPGNPPTELEIRDMFCYPKGPPSGPFEPNKWYVIPRDDSLTVVQKDSKQGKFSYVGCNVNTVTGMFVDQETDLAVKVPGGMINIQRTYADLNYSESDFPDVSSGPTWLIGTTGSGQFKMQGYPEDNKLGFVFLGEESTGTVMVQVRTVEGTKFTLPPNRYRMRVKYVKDDEGNIHILGETLEYVGDPSNRIYYEHLEEKDETFIARGRTISTTDNGASWRMEDDSGNWREYDGEGFLLSSGTPNGLIEEIIYDGERKLLGIKDRNGNQVIWVEYNEQGWISEILDNSTPEPRKVTYEYVGDHLWKMTDALGVSVNYQYDDENRIEAKNDAGAGQQITVAYYDTGNYVKEVRDNRGLNRLFAYSHDDVSGEYYAMIEYSSNKDDSRWVEEFWYDEDGNTTRIDLDGRTVKQIQRSQDGRTEVILDEKRNTTTKTYDEWDNLLKVVYPNDTEVIYEYDSHFHKVTRMVDQRGTVYTYEYDDKGNMIKKTEATGSDVARTTEYVYNADGSVAKVIAPGNATATYTYDTAGNVTSITDPLGNIAFFWDHDAMGHVLEMEDVRGKTWTSEYDARGRQTSQTDPLGRISSTVYDAANNVTTVTAFGLTTTYGYDQWYNPESVTDALGYATHTTYNGRSLPVMVEDQEGKQTHYTYDGRGRLIQEQDGAGNTLIYHYDDNLILQLHRASSELPVKIEYPTYTHWLTYDEMQRVIEECDKDKAADGEPDRCTSLTYDAGGNITTSTDADGKTTVFAYDALNRLIRQENPDGGITAYTYDDRDNLIWLKDPNGAITEFEYDANNRLFYVVRPGNRMTSYEYDAAGNRTDVYLPAGQRIKTDYDTVNRPRKTEYYAPGASTPEKTVTFTYRDGKNLVDSVTDGQVTISYDYDGLDRRTGEMIDYGNGLTLSYSYEYYANGLTKSFTGPDGVTISYKYDENNRLQTLDIPGPGQIVVNEYEWNEPVKMTFPGGSEITYGYNNFRELTSLVAKLPGGHAVLNEEYTYYPSGNLHTRKIPSAGTYIYEYDDAYRLKTVTNPVASDESYTYDLLGNRKTAANIDSEWEYNARNELLGYADVEYRYDDNGNLTQVLIADKVVWTYTYDVTNRLVHVEDGTGTIKADYGYDPFGRRLWKKVGDKTTYFLYTDEGLIGEYNADGTAIRTYGYVGGEPLFLEKNGQYYWYRNDRLGTPQTLETGSGENIGKVVWSGVYDAFGNCQVTVDEVENNLRFPGQYFDKETGLYYNLNRYYDPKIGRYLQTDPAGDGLNPYVYAAANPVNFVDPDGLCAFRMVGGIADIGVGLLLTAKTGGIGLVVAWGIIINGADNLVAGAYSMIAGEEIPSLIQSGFRRAIPNRTAADLAYMGFEISLNVAGLAVERAAQAGGSIIDNNILTRIASGDSEAITFATRNKGSLFVNREIMGEFIERHGRSAFRQIRRDYGMRVVRTGWGRTRRMAKALGITSPKRMNDISVLAAAERYGLRLVTADGALFKAAFRRGLGPGQLSARIFQYSQSQRIAFYNNIRRFIQQQSPGINPHVFTGSGF